jgi:nitrite reductase/ring-hydroxylating ferredoxin subunit
MDELLDRREMLKRSALLTGGLCLCRPTDSISATQSTCCHTPDIDSASFFIQQDTLFIDLQREKILSKQGNAVFVSIPEQEIEMIVIHSNNNEYFALERFCTHGRQVVSFNKKRNIVQCNGYNHSIFDLSGNVIKGPAPRALRSFRVVFKENRLEILLAGG